MASGAFSRFLPANPGSPSIYETFQKQDESPDHSDVAGRASMAIDEENLGEPFHDYELDDAIADATASSFMAPTSRNKKKAQKPSTGPTPILHERDHLFSYPHEVDEADDEVPQSLLIEDHDDVTSRSRQQTSKPIPSPVPGPASTATKAKWRTAREQQKLHFDVPSQEGRGRKSTRGPRGLDNLDPKERAMWRWTNVENLDNFLQDVYDYFRGYGIWCILLSRLLNLLTLAFVVGFSIFLTSCIDFKRVRSSHTMSEILVSKCTKNMSGTTNFVIWLSAFLWIGKLFQYLLDLQRLHNLHNFYRYLLEIPDSDIQTVSWQEVVKRLMALRDSNPTTAAGVTERHRRFMGTQSKQRMDAHDIANRLMRRDNYLIALINKDILDLTLPIPFFRNRQLFSKTLEWNLSLCILDYVFNEQGQVRPLFLKDTHRRALSDSLRRRFLFAGCMNVICAPFIFFYFLMLYFFRYFVEYQKNPSQIGSRQYTPFAEWKFREFNELWHLFERRVNMSYPFASRYIDQFPKEKSIQISRFVAFVAGALASILILASVVDPELFLGFEITQDRTVLFYIGVLSTIWAVARGGVPEENVVFDPEFALSNVIEYTHYCPSRWGGRLHSDEVRSEFALLYQMKVVIFLEEILSIIFTPFILWFSLPKCSDRLVDFFREFTVHIDGLGHVCSFAVFDFKKGANSMAHRESAMNRNLRDEYYATKDGKMLASYYGFIDNYVTNQKPATPFLHQPNKRHFHPPPSFPGIMSPILRGEGYSPGGGGGPNRQKRGSSRTRVPHPDNGTYSVQRTPRFGPSAGQSSTMASILLDPQHQPISTGLKSSYRPGAQSRLRASSRPLVDPIEDEEETLLKRNETLGEAGMDTAAGDGHLGESWKMTRAGATDNEGEDNVLDAPQDEGPGVLDLVYQFSKAQAGGRVTGVNI